MPIAIVLIYIALFAAGFAGYVMNILDLVVANEVSTLVVLRVIGVIVPFLGAILGYI